MNFEDTSCWITGWGETEGQYSTELIMPLSHQKTTEIRLCCGKKKCKSRHDKDNDNDNDNILFDHNLQIEITIYNSLENQIINTLVWRLLLRQNNLSGQGHVSH